MAAMLNLIRRVAEFGVRPQTTAEQAHTYRLTNVLLLLLFFASIAQTIAFFATGAIEAAILNSTAPFVFATGLYFMRAGKTLFARLFVTTICYVATYALVAVLGRETYFQFTLLFASTFSLAFFSFEEKWCLAYGMVLPLFSFVGLELTDYQPVLGMTRVALSADHLLFMRISAMILIWVLMVFHFFYFIRGRRQSQEQLISSAKMVAMGRMAAGIAHEVNNPLQRIVSHAERIKGLTNADQNAQAQIKNVADQIQTVAMQIAEIVKGLLALSRDSSRDEFREIPLHQVVKLSLDYCRARFESHQIELRVCEIPKQWSVVGREAQLSEVLLNVLNNAHDAVSESAHKLIQIDVTASSKWIEVAITDNGPGVDPNVRHRIFDPFFTTKQVGKGTGLGLSVSQGIMAAHDGQIYLEDAKPLGARFVIRIPRGRDVEVSTEVDTPGSAPVA